MRRIVVEPADEAHLGCCDARAPQRGIAIVCDACRLQHLGSIVDDSSGGAALVKEGQPQGHPDSPPLRARQHNIDVKQHYPEGVPVPQLLILQQACRLWKECVDDDDV